MDDLILTWSNSLVLLTGVCFLGVGDLKKWEKSTSIDDFRGDFLVAKTMGNSSYLMRVNLVCSLRPRALITSSSGESWLHSPPLAMLSWLADVLASLSNSVLLCDVLLSLREIDVLASSRVPMALVEGHWTCVQTGPDVSGLRCAFFVQQDNNSRTRFGGKKKFTGEEPADGRLFEIFRLSHWFAHSLDTFFASFPSLFILLHCLGNIFVSREYNGLTCCRSIWLVTVAPADHICIALTCHVNEFTASEKFPKDNRNITSPFTAVYISAIEILTCLSLSLSLPELSLRK